MVWRNWSLLLLPYLSGLTTQVIKFANYYVTERKINFRRLIEMGGMPSTHSTVAINLTTLMGIYKGIDSPFFIISLFVSAFIMIEATGVRMITGRHAMIINEIIDRMPDKENIPTQELSVPVGHTPLEVIMGSILGFVFAFAFGG